LRFGDAVVLFFVLPEEEAQVGQYAVVVVVVEGQSAGMVAEAIQHYRAILACTACVPEELHQMVTIARGTGATTLEEAIRAYHTARKRTFAARAITFARDFAATEVAKQAAIRAVAWMELGISAELQTPEALLLDQQLMFEDEHQIIKPITPLARTVLISAWRQSMQETLCEAVQTIITMGKFTNDVK